MDKFLYIFVIIKLFLCITISAKHSNLQFNHEYEQMPKLFSYHNFDKCMNSSTDLVNIYCNVRTLIRPDNANAIWNYIELFSRDYKRHYQHSALDRGVCINWCQKVVNEMDLKTQNELFVDHFHVDFPYKLNDEWFPMDPDERAQLNRIVNICINKELKEEFGLKAYSVVQVCSKSSDVIHVDSLDTAFLYILAIILGLVMASTFYDVIMGQNKGTESSILGSFSVIKNWKILISNSTGTLSQEFRFVEATRFLTMCLVIIGHITFLNVAIASDNSGELEVMYHTDMVGILSNGTQVVQTFFFLSGMFLSISYFKLLCTEEGRQTVNLRFILKGILHRYIRLTPVYAFFMLFHATWATKAFSGPFAKLGGDTERHFCRTNGWTNLLYINNYYKSTEPCFQHAWYLGTEFQLFLFGSLLMLLISKFYKYLWHIISISVACSYILPALTVYINKFDGTTIITLEAQRFMMWYHDYFHKLYIPFHVNIGNYLAGIIFGYIYQNSIKFNFVKSSIFKWIWYSVPIIIILSSAITNVFYKNDYQKPSVWMSVYFAINKNLWGIFAIIFILGILNGLGKKLRTIFSHQVFNVLGKLTYSAFLCHTFVLRLIFLNLRHMNYICYSKMLIDIVYSVIVSYSISIILNLMLEIPISVLQKSYIKRKQD